MIITPESIFLLVDGTECRTCDLEFWFVLDGARKSPQQEKRMPFEYDTETKTAKCYCLDQCGNVRFDGDSPIVNTITQCGVVFTKNGADVEIKGLL